MVAISIEHAASSLVFSGTKECDCDVQKLDTFLLQRSSSSSKVCALEGTGCLIFRQRLEVLARSFFNGGPLGVGWFKEDTRYNLISSS
jgi:hypothetical protein